LAGNAAADVNGEVRGGSFAAQLATDLRTWRSVRVPANTRDPRIGGRCAYDLEANAKVGAEPDSPR
jgi:hypothetical protein